MRVIIPIAFIDTPEYNWFEAAWPSGLRQRIANPLSRVRIPVPPPFFVFGWAGGGMADTRDLKSLPRKGVRVRLPLRPFLKPLAV